MKRIIQLLFPSKNYDAIIAAAAVFFITYLYTKHSGIGISPDSVVYLSTARNIYLNGSITTFDEVPLADFPAFYPIFLSAFIFITRLDPIAFAPVLNGLLFAAIIYISGWIMEYFIFRSKWYKYIILSCIVLSPCLLEVYSMLWSETVFIFLVLLFIISFRYYLQAHSAKRLLFVSCIVSVACVTRYAGITLIGTGGLILLLDIQLCTSKKIKHILLFGFVSATLLVANFIRNTLLSGTFTGNREKSLTSFIGNIYNFGYILCDWLPVTKSNYTIALIIGIIFIFLFVALFTRNTIKQIHFYSYENIAAAFFCVYALFMILSATLSRYETFTGRLLSPIFIPLLWGSSYVLIQLIKKSFLKKRIWIVVITVFVTLSFQANQLINNYRNYDGIKDAGMPGYTEDSWNKDSEIITFLKNHKEIFQPGYTIFSNSNEAVYFYTGLQCNMLPHIIIPLQLKKFDAYKKIYTVWFDDINNSNLINLPLLLAYKKMVPLYQFSNGTIYITTDTTKAVR